MVYGIAQSIYAQLDVETLITFACLAMVTPFPERAF